MLSRPVLPVAGDRYNPEELRAEAIFVRSGKEGCMQKKKAGVKRQDYSVLKG
jgi:hypothetical protein